MSDVSVRDSNAILLSVTNSIVVFSAMLPPLSDVRKGDKNDADIVADVRTGEMAAASLTIAIGLIATTVTGHAGPATVSVIAALALVAMYEYVLAHK